MQSGQEVREKEESGKASEKNLRERIINFIVEAGPGKLFLQRGGQ